MSKLQVALALAAEGYHVFPLEPHSKLPHIDGFPTRSSRDVEQIRSWWTDPVLGLEQDFNIGISTSRFGDGQALIVVDIDNKGGKNGSESLVKIQLEEGPLPDTAVARTPTGGFHYIFRVAQALRQSVGELGSGLDTRSRGGYIVGAGSTVETGAYTWTSPQRQPTDAPDWLVERFRVGDAAVSGATGLRTAREVPAAVDSALAADRAMAYLRRLDPAVEGERNHAGYKTAAYLKDLGVSAVECAALMAEHWLCSPPLDQRELDHVITSAFKYGESAPGSAAPEVQFSPVSTENVQAPIVDTGHPFERLNREFAFVIAGGGSHILWETVDYKGRKIVEHLNLAAFHQKFASWTMLVGKKDTPVTEEWMRHKSRRSYDGICFAPNKGSEVLVE